ncbi:hypothetical protein IFVP203_C210333 [Vibrio parahaemolyticus]
MFNRFLHQVTIYNVKPFLKAQGFGSALFCFLTICIGDVWFKRLK